MLPVTNLDRLAEERPLLADLGILAQQRSLVAESGRLAFELSLGIVIQKCPWWLIGPKHEIFVSKGSAWQNALWQHEKQAFLGG